MAPITNEEWAEVVAHELPKPSDLVIQKFLESRSALMAQEQKQRSDHSFRQALSPIAQRACAVMSKIRHSEKSTCHSEPRQTIRSWQILRRMPKGAILRAHLHSLVDVDHLLDVALHTTGVHISSSTGHLTAEESRSTAGLRLKFRSKPDPGSGLLWSDDYKPGTFVRLTEAADAYPEGGTEGFLRYLKARSRRQQPDFEFQGTPSTLARLPEIVTDLLYYEPIMRKVLQRLMTNLVEDGVNWLELGFTFPLVYYREGLEMPSPDYDHMFQAIDEELAGFRAADPGKPFWGLRIVWSGIRGQDSRSVIEDADNCIATKLAWPHLVAGYDLAGPDSLGRPPAGLLPELFWFRKQCALEGVQIPLFLSTPEDPGDGNGDAAARILFDAVLLGTRRIGTALSLSEHPRLLEAVKDKRILVELTMGSDDVPTPGPRSNIHPLPVLLAQGVACGLCGNHGGSASREEHDAGSRMTNAFWQVFQKWESVDLATLGSLAENSVRWAAFEDQDAETWSRDVRAASVGAGIKARHLQQWAVAWERFCLWVVTEYGDGVDDNV